MIRPETVERTEKHLFSSEEEMEKDGLTPAMVERILRIRDAYNYWLRHPATTDKAIVQHIRELSGIGQSKAYEDLALVKICLGDLGQVSRKWCQYLFIQRCEEGFEMARRKGDPKAFSAVLNALGKFTKLDREDADLPDYSMITPPKFEVTMNPEDAGFARIPNVKERAAMLIKKLKREALEVKAEEVTDRKQEQPLHPSQDAALYH